MLVMLLLLLFQKKKKRKNDTRLSATENYVLFTGTETLRTSDEYNWDWKSKIKL